MMGLALLSHHEICVSKLSIHEALFSNISSTSVYKVVVLRLGKKKKEEKNHVG